MNRDRIDAIAAHVPSVDLQQQLRERHHQLIQAIQFLNRSDFPLLAENSRFNYAVDAATRRAVVKVVNKETQEVLYQLPPEYVLELARQARQQQRQAAERNVAEAELDAAVSVQQG